MGKLQRFALVEFDYAVMQGMKDFVAAANGVLAPLKAPVDAVAFARFFCGHTKAAGVAAVLNRAGVTHEASPLATEIAAAFRGAIAARAAAVSGVCGDFAAPLLAKDVHVVFVTQADEALIKEALGGVIRNGVAVLQEQSQYVGGYSWENWRRISRRLGASERLCAAVVGSGISAKGAVTAGLYAAACADPLAASQDFGGTDAFAAKFDAKLVPELLRMLWKKG